MAPAAIAASKCDGVSAEAGKRLFGGSGSIGRLTLGDISGVTVNDEVADILDVLESGLEG